MSSVPYLRDLPIGTRGGSTTKETMSTKLTARERAELCVAIRDELKRGLREMGVNPKLLGDMPSECPSTTSGLGCYEVWAPTTPSLPITELAAPT